MTKTNTLTSHHPERRTSRIDKMSGMDKELKQTFVGESKKFWKRFFNKKRRQFLIQNNEEKL
jgi:hypothetical protein